MTHDKFIAIYLNDHLAIATAESEIAKRCERSNRGTALGDFLAELIADVDTDRGQLANVMDVLGVARQRTKPWAAWAGEKAGRLKLNGQIRGYSDLSRLIEIEGLMLLVSAGRELWASLKAAGPSGAGLGLPDYDVLIERADARHAELQSHHLEAARTALRDP